MLGFEPLIQIILVIIIISPFFLAWGAAANGNWGSMVILFGLCGLLFVVIGATGLLG
jgi:hypothetical protein